MKYIDADLDRHSDVHFLRSGKAYDVLRDENNRFQAIWIARWAESSRIHGRPVHPVEKIPFGPSRLEILPSLLGNWYWENGERKLKRQLTVPRCYLGFGWNSPGPDSTVIGPQVMAKVWRIVQKGNSLAVGGLKRVNPRISQELIFDLPLFTTRVGNVLEVN